MSTSPRPRKRFGQHWLRDSAILDRIVAAAALSDRDRVLEIGPGTGLLTQRLLAQAGAVVAVEVDRDLCRDLRSRFGQTPTFHLIEGDFLALNWAAALADRPAFQAPNKVVANIPYYITGPILERLLGTIAAPNPHPFEAIVLLVQQEVAQRLCSEADSKAFGALSVRVQYLADCEWVCAVPPKAFQPPPKVSSAVVRICPRPIATPAHDPQLLARLVTLGFASKRKMLRNNLSSLLERDHLLAVFRDLNIPDTIRAENLSLANWVALSNKILEDYPPSA
ncbi:MAG: 16S rRNA (adenine(1518)-N(6)/adenine(1519)-N(6))-dimethyltransferase RsmA [Leptolyngbya sp.]|nr:16S rRNA (adenine(1518)-N(6)/adenine(1519)-N(6))-dimethyltransferase RsmA [Leptolyngbya sp.]